MIPLLSSMLAVIAGTLMSSEALLRGFAQARAKPAFCIIQQKQIPDAAQRHE